MAAGGDRARPRAGKPREYLQLILSASGETRSRPRPLSVSKLSGLIRLGGGHALMGFALVAGPLPARQTQGTFFLCLN